jgi:hypothetical protein
MAGSERTELRLALAAVLTAAVSLVVERVFPGLHIVRLAVGAQLGLLGTCAAVRLRGWWRREVGSPEHKLHLH